MSKLSEVVGRKWLALVLALVAGALVCLFQPQLTEKVILYVLVWGIVYTTWQGICDIVEKHYRYKVRALEYECKKKPEPI